MKQTLLLRPWSLHGAVTLDCYYLLAMLLTSTGGGASGSVLSVWVVPEDFDETIVEKRLTASVRSAGLGVACE